MQEIFFFLLQKVSEPKSADCATESNPCLFGNMKEKKYHSLTDVLYIMHDLLPKLGKKFVIYSKILSLIKSKIFFKGFFFFFFFFFFFPIQNFKGFIDFSEIFLFFFTILFTYILRWIESSYDTSAVDDFLDKWDPSTVTPMCGLQRGLYCKITNGMWPNEVISVKFRTFQFTHNLLNE